MSDQQDHPLLGSNTDADTNTDKDTDGGTKTDGNINKKQRYRYSINIKIVDSAPTFFNFFE